MFKVNKKLVVVTAACIAMLVTIPTHHIFDMELFGYTFRFEYLIHFLLLIYGFFTSAPEVLNEKFTKLFLTMGLIGLISSAIGSAPTRSIAYAGWAIATMVTVPMVVFSLRMKLGRLFFVLVAAQVAFLSFVSIFDLLVGGAGHPEFMIGRTSGIWAGSIWRPRGWYHEPNMFVGYLLFSAIWLRLLSMKVLAKRTSRILLVIYVTSILGAVATTSRVAIPAGAFFLAWEAFQVSWRKVSRKELSWGLMALLFVAVLGEATGFRRLAFETAKTFDFRSNRSMKYRKESFLTQIEVFKDHPILGVGPGASGAYVFENRTDARYSEFAQAPPSIKRTSIGFSAVGEHLSQWGLFGSLLLIFGVYSMFGKATLAEKVLAMTLIGWVFLSSKTVQRYDLWWALSIAWVSLRTGNNQPSNAD